MDCEAILKEAGLSAKRARAHAKALETALCKRGIKEEEEKKKKKTKMVTEDITEPLNTYDKRGDKK